MRVLLVSQYFWPENFGINALVLALRERGVSLTVLTGKPNYPDGAIFPGHSAWGCRREDWQGIEVVRVPLFPRGRKSSWRLVLNYLSFVAAGLFFGSWLLRGRHFDAVFVYAPSPLLQAVPAILLARLKRAPLVVWVQDLWPESLLATGYVRNSLALGLVESVVRFIYRHSDRVLIPSQGFRVPIARLIDDPARIRYYPNAFIESVAGATSGIGGDAGVEFLAADIASGFSILFAGNLGTAQAPETILGAAQILQESASPVRIFLIGSGSRSDWLRDEIARLGLRNVVMPGRFPPGAMPAFYAAASALLVTLRDEPIFAYTIPSKVQAYLAAGRPIIACMNGEGARVVVSAGAGIACAAGNSETLVKAVLAMEAMTPQERAQLGENGRRYFSEHYEPQKLMEQLIGHLESLRAPRGGSTE